MYNLRFSAYDNFDAIDSAFYYATCYVPNAFPYSSAWESGISIFEDGGFVLNVARNTDGRCWRRLDNRLNTFYGSTYECPLSDYEVHSEAYRFVICGNLHIMSDYSRIFVDYVVSPKDEPESYADMGWGDDIANSWHHEVDGIRFDSLENIVSVSYPNATITKFGDFTTPTFDYTLSSSNISQVFNILSNIVGGVDYDSVDVNIYRSQLPTHILIGGIEKEISDLDNFNDAISTVIDIMNICRVWGIRLVIVTDPSYKESSFYLDYRNFIDNKVPDDYIIDIDRWVTEARDGDYFALETFDVFYDFIYNYISDKAIEKWHLPVHRDKYYVSLICDKITNTSYNDFMKGFSLGHLDHNNDWYTSEFNKLSTQKRENVIEWSVLPYIEQYHVNKYGSGLQSPNLFMNTGQRFVVIVHTGYSDTLWANEQFQANTNYEFLCQTDTCGENYAGRNLINTLPCRRYLSSGSENEPYHSTVYPGTGAPWFVISDNNINDYSFYEDTDGVNHMLYDCWITMSDDKNCSITIKVDGNHQQLDNWQSISFGRFPYKQTENYSYSLYCAGGSLGISNDVYVYTPAGGGTKTYVHGNSYDLDFHNVSWGHPATLLTPCKFNGANTSNFRVLSIEGIWKNIYSIIQDATVVSWPTAGPPPDYASILNNVYRYNNNDHMLFPTSNNAREINSTIFINTHGYNNITGVNHIMGTSYICNTQFIPVSVFFDKSKDHFESCQCATIPCVFCTFDKYIESGEYVAQDGSKYLIVPCGWDGRLYVYDAYDSSFGHRFKVLNEPWESCDVVDLYDSTALRGHNPFPYVMEKLAIRIG